MDDLAPGVDFRQEIEAAISESSVFIEVIGPTWIDMWDRGRRRLDDPDDPVRQEIETAFRQHIPVVAVLVRNANSPCRDQLPESLRPLADVPAVSVDVAEDGIFGMHDAYALIESQMLPYAKRWDANRSGRWVWQSMLAGILYSVELCAVYVAEILLWLQPASGKSALPLPVVLLLLFLMFAPIVVIGFLLTRRTVSIWKRIGAVGVASMVAWVLGTLGMTVIAFMLGAKSPVGASPSNWVAPYVSSIVVAWLFSSIVGLVGVALAHVHPRPTFSFSTRIRTLPHEVGLRDRVYDIPPILVVSRSGDGVLAATWVGQRLRETFSKSAVQLVTSENLPIEQMDGKDFAGYHVVVLLIARHWLRGPDGQSYLEDPADPVRRWLQTVLASDLLVIPVLVEGAAVPPVSELPACLHRLARLNAVQVRPGRDGLLDIQKVERTVGVRVQPRVPFPPSNPASAALGMGAKVGTLSALAVALVMVTSHLLAGVPGLAIASVYRDVLGVGTPLVVLVLFAIASLLAGFVLARRIGTLVHAAVGGMVAVLVNTFVLEIVYGVLTQAFVDLWTSMIIGLFVMVWTGAALGLIGGLGGRRVYRRRHPIERAVSAPATPMNAVMPYLTWEQMQARESRSSRANVVLVTSFLATGDSALSIRMKEHLAAKFDARFVEREPNEWSRHLPSLAAVVVIVGAGAVVPLIDGRWRLATPAPLRAFATYLLNMALARGVPIVMLVASDVPQPVAGPAEVPLDFRLFKPPLVVRGDPDVQRDMAAVNLALVNLGVPSGSGVGQSALVGGVVAALCMFVSVGVLSIASRLTSADLMEGGLLFWLAMLAGALFAGVIAGRRSGRVLAGLWGGVVADGVGGISAGLFYSVVAGSITIAAMREPTALGTYIAIYGVCCPGLFVPLALAFGALGGQVGRAAFRREETRRAGV